jgi:hypothetical protein
MKNGKIVDPILVTDSNANSKNVDVKTCGSNYYLFTNYTIIFVVTEAIDCLVTVYLEETIQLTTRFSMDINTFFTDNTQTKFIDRLAALLSISDASRIKIVGVYSGSTIVYTSIFPSATNVSGATEPSLTKVSTTLQ